MSVLTLFAGIFWAQEALWHMYNPEYLDKKTTEGVGVRIPFLEHLQYGREPADVIRGRPSPRVYKYHMSAKFLERHLKEGKVKVIVWLMNPRTVMAGYHELYNIKAMNYVNFPKVDWDTFFELLKRDEMWEGNWFESSLSYLEQKDNPNIMVLNYEEAAKDLKATAHKMAEFCGRKVTEEQVEKLTKVEPFDKPMDWKKKFSPEQEKYFNELYISKTKGTPLENMYKE